MLFIWGTTTKASANAALASEGIHAFPPLRKQAIRREKEPGLQRVSDVRG
jgi:hypothetical protein